MGEGFDRAAFLEMAERLVQANLERDKLPGVIYFIKCGEFALVKIGHTRSQDSRKRFTSHQTSSPFKLRLLLEIPGYIEDEMTFHERFRKHKVRGEWYRLEGELQEFINTHPQKVPPNRRRSRTYRV